MNSNENDSRPAASRSRMRGARCMARDRMVSRLASAPAWRGAGGEDGHAILAAAAALELLHASALVHDDVMDASDTRRGRPSLHRWFAIRHAEQRWQGSPESFGTGAAILMGDLLLSWTDG